MLRSGPVKDRKAAASRINSFVLWFGTSHTIQKCLFDPLNLKNRLNLSTDMANNIQKGNSNEEKKGKTNTDRITKTKPATMCTRKKPIRNELQWRGMEWKIPPTPVG